MKLNIPKLNWRNPFVRHPGLKAMGDTDKDGVKNWVDCQPFNKKKQDEVLNMQDTIVKSTPQRKADFYRNPPEELGEVDTGIYREGIKWREMKQ